MNQLCKHINISYLSTNTPRLWVLLLLVFISISQLNCAQIQFSTDRQLQSKSTEFYNRITKYNNLDSNKLVIKYVDEAIKFAKSNRLIVLEGVALSYRVSVFQKIGKTDAAIQLAYRIISMGDRYNNDWIRIAGQKQLGYIFYSLDETLKALRCFQKMEAYYIRLKKTNVKEYYDLLQNIGAFYFTSLPNKSLADFDKSIAYLSKARNYYFKGKNVESDLGGLYQNFGLLEYTKFDYTKDPKNLKRAIELFDSANVIFKNLGDKKSLGITYTNIGQTYYKMQNNDASMLAFLKAQKFTEETKDYRNQTTIFDYLRYLYELKKEYKKAYDYMELKARISDSLKAKEYAKSADDLEIKHQTEQKETQIRLLEKDKKIQDKDLERQKTVRNLLIAGFVFFGFFVVMLINRFLLIRKQKTIIEEQKALVDHKNKDITDSINYAKRIQTALLNTDTVGNNGFNHSVLFLPKDIVSGDFYWIFEKQDFTYLAVADCTGHGVPGAFLTMLGTSFLGEISATEEVLTPAEILQQLRSKFIHSLSQSGKVGENKDGMDISLARINTKTKELIWSGANNPLWLVRRSHGVPQELLLHGEKVMQVDGWQISEVKANKQPIGYSDELKPFTDHTLHLRSKDQLFLFSDGFADQFGGPKGKKLKASYMKELLLNAVNLDVSEQMNYLETAFHDWKKYMEQVDDVCVIGIHVN